MISVIPSRSISRATADVSATVIGNAAPPRCLWSSATLAGPPDLLDDRREPIEETRREVEPDVRYANIATTEGTGAAAMGTPRSSAVDRSRVAPTTVLGWMAPTDSTTGPVATDR